jgi:hypothetical protein
MISPVPLSLPHFLLAFLSLLLIIIPHDSRLYQFFKPLITHGKGYCAPPSSVKAESVNTPLAVIRWLLYARLPKSYFIHFYATGLITSTVIILTLYRSKGFGVDQIKVIAFLALLNTHLLRRFVECWIFDRPGVRDPEFKPTSSSSSMSLPSYLLGMWFYVTLPICYSYQVLDETPFKDDEEERGVSYYIQLVLSLVLFFGAQAMQFSVHRYLATLKTLKRSSSSSSNTARPVPDGHYLFTLLIFPHYFMEISIYVGLSFLALTLGLTSILPIFGVLAFVTLNLSLNAKEQVFSYYGVEVLDGGAEEGGRRKRWMLIRDVY